MQKERESSPMMQAKKLESPTSLTEFAPLSPEVKPQSSPFSFSRLFRRNKSQKEKTPSEGTPATSDDESYKQTANQSKERYLLNPTLPLNDDLLQSETDSSCAPSCSSSCTEPPPIHISSTNSPEEGQGRNMEMIYSRSMTNVLKRIANLLDKKNSTLQDYKDSEFKQYWMPDSNCKECYECGEKFTTFRRRHHCRICGQIFCRRCCNQAIPGKVMGCTGDLRVCTYCCKVVLSYVQTLDASTEVSGDVRALQDDLQQKLSVLTEQADTGIVPDNGVKNTMRRKSSVMGFREEEIAKAKPLSRTEVSDYASSSLTSMQAMSPERRAIAKDTVVLQQLWAQIQHRVNGIDFQNHRCRLRTYANCVVGSELVDWLVNQEKASSRAKAVVIGQALLDAKILECVISHEQLFVDDFVLYRPGEGSKLENLVLPIVRHNTTGSQEGQEPLWVKEIQPSAEVETDGSTEVAEQMVVIPEENKSPPDLKRLSSSNSTFCLSLDIKESRVRVSRPSYASPPTSPIGSIVCEDNSCCEGKDLTAAVKEFNEAQLSGESINAETTGDFLRAALCVDPLNAQAQEEVNVPQGWHNAQQLREDNGEKLAFERLNSAYDSHEQALLRQLLSQEGLSLSWCDIILPIIHRVKDTVRPDVRNDNDDMDIRQYVQFKKIPGGSKSECAIVSGVTFTKNVAHKKMKQNIFNPTILLLSSSIVYQRVENKLSSLDPIIMQEYEYLKNAVAKVTVCKPDVLLVEKTVSRLAQEMLLSMGVTLILNVKTSVMERIARCTQGAIVTSIDAHLGRPQLGTCHHFRVNTFHLPGYKTKNLVFFDGCPANLGCTILLRGGSGAELKKVKSITQFMVYVAYNWRLERSFLMDAFAMPPTPSDETSLIIDNNCTDTRSLKDAFQNNNNNSNVTEDTKLSENCKEIDKWNNGSVKETKLHKRPLNLNLKNSPTAETDTKSTHFSEESSKKLESIYIEDFSDPLRSYLHSEESTFQTQETSLYVDTFPVSNRFRKALDDVILCCSPNIDVSLPYLETEAGRNCELRHFFPEEIYWSEQFSKDGENVNKWTSLVDCDDVSLQSAALSMNQDMVELVPPHKFISYKIIDHTSNIVQSLVADFRARGRTVKCLCPHERVVKDREKKPKIDLSQMISLGQPLKSADIQPPTGLCWEKQVDALSPYNHQRLSVLFCSYSCTSNNAPNFCVNPWVVRMDFSGSNDITLGGFLERYCFRSSYVCPSYTCDTPMTEHVRKFVHENGCVHILLHKLETAIEATESNILMWSWCCKCKQASPVVLVSQDTWSLSFAKYLELRFHGSKYGRRGVSEHCPHSLNHDHHHYFAHKQLVATFKYTPIVVWEVVLPPPVIVIQDYPIPVNTIVEEIKFLAIKGSEVYSSVLEKLCTLESDYQDTAWEDIIAKMIDLQKVIQLIRIRLIM